MQGQVQCQQRQCIWAFGGVDRGDCRLELKRGHQAEAEEVPARRGHAWQLTWGTFGEDVDVGHALHVVAEEEGLARAKFVEKGEESAHICRRGEGRKGPNRWGWKKKTLSRAAHGWA